MYDCPCCGSRNIIIDECRGDCICKNCGVVVEEKIVVVDQTIPLVRMEKEI